MSEHAKKERRERSDPARTAVEKRLERRRRQLDYLRELITGDEEVLIAMDRAKERARGVTGVRVTREPVDEAVREMMNAERTLGNALAGKES